MKKGALILLLIFVFSSILKVNAGFVDVPNDSFYSSSIQKVSELGIMNGIGRGFFSPDTLLTREQFARVIISSMGLEEEAFSRGGVSVFSDVPHHGWSVGFINLAFEKGLVRGKSDGRFHPHEPVTLAQISTIFIRLLGYDDSDLIGAWPKNYLDKAESIELIKGIHGAGDENLSRGMLSVLIDRLLETNMKAVEARGKLEPFAKHYNIFDDVLIIEKSNTSDKLNPGWVLTDKGILDASEFFDRIEVGNIYRIQFDSDKIVKIYAQIGYTLEGLVDSIDGDQLTYRRGSRILSEKLDDRATYYYNGEKINYNQVKDKLLKNTKITFSSSEKTIKYDKILIKDPEYLNKGTLEEHIVIGTSKNLKGLPKKYIVTNKGTYYIENEDDARMGVKYQVLINENVVLDLINPIGKIKELTVKNFSEGTVSFVENEKETLMTLPSNMDYYYNGEKIEYGRLNSLMIRNMGIILGSISRDDGYDYAILLDPIYSKPHVLDQKLTLGNMFGDILIYNHLDVMKDYKRASLNDISIGNVIYTVKDPWGQNPYLFVLDRTVEGEVTSVLTNKFNHVKIGINEVEYEIDTYFKANKGHDLLNSIKTGDFVLLVLGEDNKILDLEKLLYRSGVEQEIILVATKTTNEILGSNQILTDRGIYYTPLSLQELKIGQKYKVKVDGKNILEMKEIASRLEYFVVENVLGNQLTAKITNSFGNEVLQKLHLPYGIPYYYNENELQSINISTYLIPNSTLILAVDSRNVGYEYAIVVPPVYSKPVILDGVVYWGSVRGPLVFTPYVKIVKNGNLVKISDLNFEDVVYEVYDYRKTTKYIIAYDNKVVGILSEITPNPMSPQIIQIDDTKFELSMHANIEAFHNTSSNIKTGNIIRALLGRDGKVIRVGW
jgi:hypothetical protein